MAATGDTSRVDAVNSMLSTIGEQPVNDLTNKTPEVAMAEQVLDECIRDLLTKAWHFNTEKVTIAPGSDGKIAWRDHWQRVDTAPNRYSDIDVVRRGDYLYNRAKATDVFTQSLELHIVRWLDWEDLPERARLFLLKKSSRIFEGRTLNDPTRTREESKDEMRAWADLQEEEANQADANIFDYHPRDNLSFFPRVT